MRQHPWKASLERGQDMGSLYCVKLRQLRDLKAFHKIGTPVAICFRGQMDIQSWHIRKACHNASQRYQPSGFNERYSILMLQIHVSKTFLAYSGSPWGRFSPESASSETHLRERPRKMWPEEGLQAIESRSNDHLRESKGLISG